jgi:hypothetical protein
MLIMNVNIDNMIVNVETEKEVLNYTYTSYIMSTWKYELKYITQTFNNTKLKV